MTSADEIKQAEQEYKAASDEHARLQERWEQLRGPVKPLGEGKPPAYTDEHIAALDAAYEAGERLIAALGKLIKARGFDIG